VGDEVVTKPLKAGNQKTCNDRPIGLMFLRSANRVAALSGVKEFLRQLRSPKYIRNAL
jgi:hypothetical protein